MGSTCSKPSSSSVYRLRPGQPKFHHALLRGSNSDNTLEERDAFGYSALHLCAFKNDTKMASRFVQYMKSLEQKAYGTDRTPLHVASWMQSVGMVKLLVDNHADVNAVDDFAIDTTTLIVYKSSIILCNKGNCIHIDNMRCKCLPT